MPFPISKTVTATGVNYLQMSFERVKKPDGKWYIQGSHGYVFTDTNGNPLVELQKFTVAQLEMEEELMKTQMAEEYAALAKLRNLFVGKINRQEGI